MYLYYHQLLRNPLRKHKTAIDTLLRNSIHYLLFNVWGCAMTCSNLPITVHWIMLIALHIELIKEDEKKQNK